MSARAEKTKNAGERKSHLAVVDDDPSVHDAVRGHLQRAGERWHVTAYHNGEDALKGIAAAPPQVVLMEQTLPDGCGLRCPLGADSARGGSSHVFVPTRAEKGCGGCLGD